MADTKISNLPAVAAPAGGDEFACNQAGVTKKETKTQITAATDAALAADVANLAAHVATTTTPIHGSSVAAGANTLVHRNAAGRAQFVNPTAAQDASTKNYSDTQDAAHAALTAAGTHGSSVAAAANTLMHRDAAGRSQVAAPAAGADVSTKTYVDAQTHVGGYGALITPAGITDRMRKFFIPVSGGWNQTDTVDMTTFSLKGIELPDTKNAYAWGYGIVPEDFASGMTVTSVIWPNNPGNVYGQTTVDYGQCGELTNQHTDTSGALAAVAIVFDENNCIHTAILANEAKGDIFRCQYRRDASNVLDTVNDACAIAGFIVEYTADC